MWLWAVGAEGEEATSAGEPPVLGVGETEAKLGVGDGGGWGWGDGGRAVWGACTMRSPPG